MDVSETAARVNFELMQRHIHKKVLLVGQIESRDNNLMRVRAADGGIVQVRVDPSIQFETKYVEFEGLVESPTQLSASKHKTFGDKFDLGAYNELCKLVNQDYPRMFL